MFEQGFGLLWPEQEQGALTAIERPALAEAIRRHRVVLFRNTAQSSADFLTLGERMGATFHDYRAGAYQRDRIGNNATLFSVTGGRIRKPVPFHGEMHYVRQKPDLLWFFCQEPAQRRGQTTLCHGGQVYDALQPESKAWFSENDICYIRSYTPEKRRLIFQTESREEIEAMCAHQGLTFEWDHHGKLVTSYRCRAVLEHPEEGPVFVNNVLTVATWEMADLTAAVVRDGKGHPIPRAILKDAWRAAQRRMVAHRWQKGDLLIIDNQVMMHGRKTIACDRRDIYVRMSGGIPT